MNILKQLSAAVRFTLVTTVLLGVIYPLLVTAIAQIAFPDQANGQLIESNGRVVGSRILGQSFTAPAYFHGRPSAAGAGYDATSSSGTNLGPTSHALFEAVTTRVAAARAESAGAIVPVDMVTSSASGLDPHISPANALFQVPRVARERNATEADVRALVESHVEGRQFGVLGEPRVNVLMLNLDLDARWPRR